MTPMTDTMLWKTKLHARLHDPVEKALILMRDPGASHEEGTSRELRKIIFGAPEQAIGEIENCLRRADWWASSTDRVPFPKGSADGAYPAWQQVRFDEEPVLVHPISGNAYPIDSERNGLKSTSADEIKLGALTHFAGLVHRNDAGEVDLERTLLALWRFGPDLRPGSFSDRFGALWPLLPADTRTPDQTIWQHLDLTSAFAGAFGGDASNEASLLSISFGPVQDFIALGRSTSDLWAGSHFLSRVAWEGLKVICEELGPDAVLFPQLLGIPLVDSWLANEKGLDPSLFAEAEWKNVRTDGNPLFIAALPNKLVAVVPAGRAQAIAEKVRDAMRSFVMRTGLDALKTVLNEAAKDDAHCPFDAKDESLPCYAQLRLQLAGFPDVQWSAVPFSIAAGDDPEQADETRLRELLALFHPAANGIGYLDSPAWKAFQALSQTNRDGTEAWIWDARPAGLYPAVFDLLDRSLSANKSLRVFEGALQEGFRCSLSAEVEWLTTDRRQLAMSSGQRRSQGTLWTRLAKARPSWVKRDEHLGSLALLKRLWPTLFMKEVRIATGFEVQRFVLSSHALALAPSLAAWLEQPDGADSDAAQHIIDRAEPSVLPGKVMRKNAKGSSRAYDIARRIPDYLDGARSSDDDAERRKREQNVSKLLGRKPETYYGMVLMDGDNMGAWLSGSNAPEYDALFHPQIRSQLDKRFAHLRELSDYRAAPRAPSPAFHGAISSALNGFALHLAQPVVERAYLGKLLYAGGDDLMALCSSTDLPQLMTSLRAVYSGSPLPELEAQRLLAAGISRCGGGHALVNGRLVRLMGEAATASMGAIVAHQMAPLGSVLRELRAAEHRAKRDGGRDAFSLTLVKRSGGSQTLTAKWRYGHIDTLAVFGRLRAFLSSPEVSRRAVYNSMQWMRDLPEPTGDGDMLQSLLSFQLARQARGDVAKAQARSLAPELVALNLAERTRLREVSSRNGEGAFAFLRTFLSVAEFLAREQRNGERT